MENQAPKDETITKVLQVIGEALSIEPDDFQDHETWKFLGLSDLLVTATAADLQREGIAVTKEDFETYDTVGALKQFLHGGESDLPQGAHGKAHHNTSPTTDPWIGMPKPKVPVSVILQGTPDKSKIIVFLFPDGSGAGTAYSTLPHLGADVCLVAMNSPFLRQAQDVTCPVERMAKLWLPELQRLQPRGRPYTIGGWSAGGYYAYEVAKLLSDANEKVQRLILIDSPCRLEFEALPVNVVKELTVKGLLGGKAPPDWMVSHFIFAVLSIDNYMPTPMESHQVPDNVDIIWCREGLIHRIDSSGLDVDATINVTKFLLEPRGDLKTEYWEKLMRSAEYTVSFMTGHHFQVAQPPHANNLGMIISRLILAV